MTLGPSGFWDAGYGVQHCTLILSVSYSVISVKDTSEGCGIEGRETKNTP
jgi:hypothetical protein